jgi:glycosyltransferase involved in cell wall biosynthesis
MRIAYIAPYQGPALVKERPIVRNLSLAGRVKVERLTELLLQSSHEVEIISQGEVIERKFKIYPVFTESEPFNSNVPVYYASSLPVRHLNGLWSSLSMRRIFKARHRAAPFDLVLIYNLKPPQVACARHAFRLGLPVILEYEDGAFGKGTTKKNRNFTSGFYLDGARKVLQSVSGCIAVSPDLLAQTQPGIPSFLLRGVVSGEILAASGQANGCRNDRVVYSGTHYRAYGLEQLITAWKALDLPGWELHIAGQGELTDKLHELARDNANIVFHGLLNRRQNAEFLASARIGINAHYTGHTSGNVFAFKLVEYLAAGLHAISTPMGNLPANMEAGLTYMNDNSPQTIATTLRHVIESRVYERTAALATSEHYGSEAVSRSLDQLLDEVRARSNHN